MTLKKRETEAERSFTGARQTASERGGTEDCYRYAPSEAIAEVSCGEDADRRRRQDRNRPADPDGPTISLVS